MKNHNLLTRTLIAAALLTGATAAQAVSVGASVGANVDAATQAATDTALTGTVKAKLATDARVKGSDISVTTENGVVVLTGKAPTAEAKSAAEDIAKSANASAKIENRIEAPGLLSTVKAETKTGVAATEEVVSDSWITTKLKTQLLADTLTKGTAIKVTTKDNVVFLKGTVASQAEKDQAIKLAGETKGVAKVNSNKLKVSTKVKAEAAAQ